MAIVIPASGRGDELPNVATDEVGGAHYQWMKQAFGIAGVATPVSTGNPLPVRVGDVSTAAPLPVRIIGLESTSDNLVRAASSSPVFASHQALTVTIREMISAGTDIFSPNPGKLMPIAGKSITDHAFRYLPIWESVQAMPPRSNYGAVLMQMKTADIEGTGTLSGLYPAAAGLVTFDGGLRFNGQTGLVTIEDTNVFVGTIEVYGLPFASAVQFGPLFLIDAVTGRAENVLAVGKSYYLPAAGNWTSFLFRAATYSSGTATLRLINSNQPSAVFMQGSVLNDVIANPTRPGVAAVAAAFENSTSTAPFNLLTTSPTRRGGLIYNDVPTGTLYGRFGGAASTSDYSFTLAFGQSYEIPHPAFTGRIGGLMISTSTVGSVRASELTT